MPDVDGSFLDKKALSESYHVALDDFIIDLAWSPDGAKLAVVTVEGGVFLIDPERDATDPEFIGQHDGGGNSISWSWDGAEFATAGHDGVAKVWDGHSGREIARVQAGDSWVGKVVYHPRKRVLATVAGKHLRLWSEQRALLYESSEHSSTIADAGWNPDGTGIAVAAYQGITLHAPGKQRQPRKYIWKGSSVVLAWSPDSKYMATGEQDSKVHFWHVKSGEDAQMWGFPTKVLELSWDPSGQWLATGGGATVALWDCSGKGPSGRKPRAYEAHSNKLTQLAFQPDGQLLASADIDSTLALWDPLRHDKVIGGSLLSAPASCLRWRQGGVFAVGLQDGKILIYHVQPQYRS